jgi:cyclic beta-1,2-glucan glucanotransferase
VVWYTGSNGWMYRVGLEAILGIQRLAKTLRISPCIPKDWSNYRVTYRVGETIFQIQVNNLTGVNRGVAQVTLDGKVLPGSEIPLLEDGNEHRVDILMGAHAS